MIVDATFNENAFGQRERCYDTLTSGNLPDTATFDDNMINLCNQKAGQLITDATNTAALIFKTTNDMKIIFNKDKELKINNTCFFIDLELRTMYLEQPQTYKNSIIHTMKNGEWINSRSTINLHATDLKLAVEMNALKVV
jgi:hypothetical protein